MSPGEGELLLCQKDWVHKDGTHQPQATATEIGTADRQALCHSPKPISKLDIIMVILHILCSVTASRGIFPEVSISVISTIWECNQTVMRFLVSVMRCPVLPQRLHLFCDACAGCCLRISNFAGFWQWTMCCTVIHPHVLFSVAAWCFLIHQDLQVKHCLVYCGQNNMDAPQPASYIWIFFPVDLEQREQGFCALFIQYVCLAWELR